DRYVLALSHNIRHQMSCTRVVPRYCCRVAEEVSDGAGIEPESERQSSPICLAEGLGSALLICHGVVDTNVLFQDSVRLVQRLIELRKDHWSVAPFPVENHGFEDETSWADEYRRILKLFDDTLKVKTEKSKEKTHN